MSRVVGIVLILAGAAVLIWGRNFTTSRDVVEIGSLTVTTEEPRPIAPWVAFVMLGAGVALVAVDVVRKEKA